MTITRRTMTTRRTLIRACTAAAAVGTAHVAAHGGHEEVASVAGTEEGHESYIQRHMASEHHIGAFDLGSFFALHDLDRNGVWDRSEIEAIYGVHHSTSVKHSPNYEVHDEKANKIVGEVLRRLDRDNDGLITMTEFTSQGPDGLPSFEQYGKNVLGHHYDEESEYFVHHEEVYHKTPDQQTEDSYNHPEDIEHFKHHEKIEKEEERRERHAEGMPSMEEDERRRKIAEARGEKYVSPYDAQMPKEDSPAAPQRAFEPHAEHPYAQEQSFSTEHVFKTPEGDHVVKSAPVKPEEAVPPPQKQQNEQQPGASRISNGPARLQGETDEGYKDRLAAFENAKQAQAAFAQTNPDLVSPGIDPKTGEAKRMPGETDEMFAQRKVRVKFEQIQRAQPYRPANKQDLRKSAPYKYPPIQNRLKKTSFFGEF